jgi:hypothetical protein
MPTQEVGGLQDTVVLSVYCLIPFTFKLKCGHQWLFSDDKDYIAEFGEKLCLCNYFGVSDFKAESAGICQVAQNSR